MARNRTIIDWRGPPHGIRPDHQQILKPVDRVPSDHWLRSPPTPGKNKAADESERGEDTNGAAHERHGKAV